MTQYIDKAAALAEIDRRIESCTKQREDMLKAQCHTLADDASARMGELNCVKDFLNALEAKEIDLADSAKETIAQNYVAYTFKRHNIDPSSKEGQLIYHAYMHGMNQCLTQLRTKDIK